MSGLHSLSIGQSHRDAMLGGEFVNAVFPGPMKWLVQPEPTMAWRSSNGLWEGTKVLRENKLFKTKKSLGLTVP